MYKVDRRYLEVRTPILRHMIEPWAKASQLAHIIGHPTNSDSEWTEKSLCAICALIEIADPI